MEDAEVSPQYKSTSLSVPSPTASHIACLSGARLQIRSLATFEIIRSIALPNSHDLRNSRLAWSPQTSHFHSSSDDESTPPRGSQALRSNRILVFDDESTRVYDLRDERWSAVISNGSGGMGKNVHVEFGATEDEVLVWSDFAACVKAWCLKTGRAVEIRDAKFPGRDGRGWAYRPSKSSRHGRGQVMALLCRTSGTDVLLLLSAQTYALLSRVELPTVDAANLKWSRDGRWLAIWDAASAGYSLHIYTADGNLYRTITREPSEEIEAWGIEGLGIKSVEWIPGNEKLAVGGWDRRVRILSTRTFAPVVFLDHTPIIHVPEAPVYTEHIDSHGNRSYQITTQPTTAPKVQLEKNETALMKLGISIVAFNVDGTLCATRDDSTPSTVWIWDLTTLKPRIILIQYSPVKTLQWHPHDPSRLLIQANHDAPAIYIYTAQYLSSPPPSSSSSSLHPPPAILTLEPHHITKPTNPCPRWTCSWLSTHARQKPMVALGHQQAYVVLWPEGKEQILRFGVAGESESDDSLYEILTGGRGASGSGVDVHVRDDDDDDEQVQDTFHAKIGNAHLPKRHRGPDQNTALPPTQTRKDLGLGESGVDEMF